MSVGQFVRFCAVAAGAVALAGSAQAADITGGNGYGGYKDEPAFVRAPAWQGLYVGANAGWAWSSVAAADNTVLLTNAGSMPFGSPGTRGFFGGVQVGYNVQNGNFLFGVEADFGGLDDDACGSFTDPANTKRILLVKSYPGFYGDIAIRSGFTMANVLLYAKGGFAAFTGDVRLTDIFDGIDQNSGTFTGWTVGGGFEYMLTPNWTVKAEYQYFDLANNNFSCCIGATNGRLDNSLTANTVKVGFNFLLHSQHSPLN